MTQPTITLKWENPYLDKGRYFVTLVAKSSIEGKRIFGCNFRFFIDSSQLHDPKFETFVHPYAAHPPLISTDSVKTANAASAGLFKFKGAATYVNIAFINKDKAVTDWIELDPINWADILTMSFAIKPQPPGQFAPCIILDKMYDPTKGSLMPPNTGEGVVITVVSDEVNAQGQPMDSAPAIEQVVPFNWQYNGSLKYPYGAPFVTDPVTI